MSVHPPGGRSREDVADRPRRAGRPLDPSLDVAIQAAVLQVLAECGYAALTMDEVALTAGVSKATIYRRWPTKADLLVSVIDAASEAILHVPDTKSLRDDLVVLLTSLADVLAGPGGRASRALLGALNDEPALREAYQRGPMARWAEGFQQVFQRAVARGEVDAGAGTSLAAEAGPAILLERWMGVSGLALDERLPGEVVDKVMMPLFERH